MTLTLRGKLLLVSLSMLTLPWAGWQVLRQMEALLRSGQEQALRATGDALARALAAQPGKLPEPLPAWFVAELAQAPRLDGRDDDWPASSRAAYRLADGRIALALGKARERVYLLVQVRADAEGAADAHWPIAGRRDHLRLRLRAANRETDLRLANTADGPVQVSTIDGKPAPIAIEGFWRRNADGWAVELALPQGWPLDALGIAATDAGATTTSELMHASFVHPWPLRMRSIALSAALAALLPPGVHGEWLDADGWVLAAAGDIDAGSEPRRVPLWRRWLYRALLPVPALDPGTIAPAPRRAAHAQGWTRAGGERLLLSLDAPAPPAAGSLRLTRESEAVLLLADRGLRSLLGHTALALLTTGLLLFVFAGRLGTRVRRLAQAAGRALDRDGRIGPLPGRDASDELGDLARSFDALLREVGEWTRYLRSLAGKLSHEINTPLAIVRSSLDNLSLEPLAPGAAAYVERARAGVDRLGGLVRAMSEATALEQAIAGAERETFDLRALLRELGEAYRPLLAPRRLELELPARPLMLHGAPDLIVQAMDKLIDNARGFCPSDGWIRIALVESTRGAVLSVANAGPPLPEAMRERLFDALVSVRDRHRAEGGAHLGLGLRVVKLVVEWHCGSVVARDLADAGGVEFELTLPAM